jgi:hypothetical protein
MVPFAVAYHGPANRCVRRDPGFPAAAFRRTGMGVGQRLFKLGALGGS